MLRLELDYVELGVAWQQSRLPALPSIFTWRNKASLPNDPERALQDAGARLRNRGLIDSRGQLHDDLHDALSTFTHARFEVDLRFASKPNVEMRAAVTAGDRTGILGATDGDRVIFVWHPADAVVGALVREMPEIRPARGTAISVPSAAFDAAIAETAEDGDGGDQSVMSALRRQGVSFDDARMFVALVGGRRYRYGKFGMAVRDVRGERHRSDLLVHAIDKDPGRSALYTRQGYLIAAPADDALFVRLLTERLEHEQRRIRDEW